jgi:three-Cys-motif partner protein
VTQQAMFGGGWTQRKLDVLKKYLQAYTKIFKRNPRAQHYSITYVDAFAGTGTLRRPALGGLAKLLPELFENEEEFRKGSVRRALEVEPPFNNMSLSRRMPRSAMSFRPYLLISRIEM